MVAELVVTWRRSWWGVSGCLGLTPGKIEVARLMALSVPEGEKSLAPPAELMLVSLSP